MINKESIQSKIDEALKSFKIAQYQDAINILEFITTPLLLNVLKNQ